MKYTLFLLLLLYSVIVPAQDQRTSFTPGLMWYDTSGNPINAHGGGISGFLHSYVRYMETGYAIRRSVDMAAALFQR